MDDKAIEITAACEASWLAWKRDGSGFVKAVASQRDIVLIGNANRMIADLIAAPEWQKLGNDQQRAMQFAGRGKLVIAGLVGATDGHVAIIVKSGPSLHPVGYWGRLGSIGRKNASISLGWSADDLKNVCFFAHDA